jgi:hypothetical protein
MQLAKPRRNTSKDVRLRTMRATELRGVADQAGKTLSVQVEASVDHVASRWAEKREWLHDAEHLSFADTTQVDEILFEGEDLEIYLFGRHMRRKAHPVQSDMPRAKAA